MIIKDMFEKRIDRKIKGVIKVDQKEEDLIAQELSEYIVTDELLKHFKVFFENYNEALNTPTDDIGVWISGFFGSGKSHFLKILSYLLSNKKVQDKYAIDYFKDDNKITDESIIKNMENATKVDTDVILFNIDSKSSESDNKKDKILDVFVKVFNEHVGYIADLPFLAELEKTLDSKNKYQEFKDEFERIYGESWVESRNDYYAILDDIIQALVNIDFMTEKTAINWSEKAEENYSMSIEKFAENINEYCESKGSNHHLIFLVDEVGQYISEDTQLMLNLQTLTENLGSKCNGKAWIIVTSQQNIDDITNVKGQDFSKIQGRFKTRLSLSSSNVDEVIKKRLLAKKVSADETLQAEYPQNEPIIKNLITFKDSAEMKTYKDAEDYASIYPFVPYQFNLLQNVLTAIREHGASGKHLAEGERSMLALFQESVVEIMDKEDGTFICFNKFYDPLDQFIDHSHSSVINKAKKNDNLDDFDVKVLKVLFLIRYVKEIKSYPENIATLMVSKIDEDKIDLKKNVEDSLKRLVKETLVQKNGTEYIFLTNQEQDVNREIKNVIIEEGDILKEAAKRIFERIIESDKYTYTNRYIFGFNRYIDDTIYNKEKKDNEIGIKIISPKYDFTISDTSQSTIDNSSLDANKILALKGLSDVSNNLVIDLNNEDNVFNEIEEAEQINKYLHKHGSNMDSKLKVSKQEEFNEKNERIRRLLEDSMTHADIYVKGSKLDLTEKNPKDRIDDALRIMIEEVFSKLKDMENSPGDAEIKEVLQTKYLDEYTHTQPDSRLLLDDLDNYIDIHSQKGSKLSLKEIIDRYKKIPFGLIEDDIEWLVASLFNQKRISLIYDDEELSIKKEGFTTIFNYLTKPEYREKILIGKKKETSKKKIKSAKNILDEVFEKSSSSEDDEDLMDKVIEEMEIKLEDIENSLNYYSKPNMYKGEDYLKHAKSVYKEIIDSLTISQFYEKIFKNEDEILDASEEIEPILQFFNSNQKKIFDQSVEILKNYKESDALIFDEDLNNIIEKIDKIVKMPSPYSHIKDLPTLNEEYTLKYEKILEDEKKPVLEYIKNLQKETIDYIESKKEYKEMLNYANSKFGELIENLEDSDNVSKLPVIKTQADNTKDKIIDDIEELIKIKKSKEQKLEQSTAKTTKPAIKDIKIEQLDLPTSVSLKNYKEISKFTDQIKSKLAEELGDNDELNLQLK